MEKQTYKTAYDMFKADFSLFSLFRQDSLWKLLIDYRKTI